MRENSKISVITPSYNCADYIRDCIESVLAQNYENFEHIIVDGASQDGTVEILKQYPHLKWISEPDKGEAEALNKALRMASGDIINWLNADDCYFGTEVFRSVAEEIDAEHGRHLIYGKALIINDKDEFIGLRIPRDTLTLPTLMRWFSHIHLYQPSMFYSKELVRDVGLYREELYFSIDYDYWLRIAAKGYQYHYIDRVFAKARLLRPSAKSAQPRVAQEQNWLEVCTTYLEALSPPSRIDFWKDYYQYRIQHYQQYNQPIAQPQDKYALIGLSLAIMDMGQLVDTRFLLNHLVTDPDAADIYWLLGEALYRGGHPNEAKRAFARAITLDPHNASVANELALTEVVEPQQTAVDLNTPDARLIGNLSATQVERGVTTSITEANKKKALVFFPHNPYPPRTGAHRHGCLEVLSALKELGCEVTLFSSTLFTDNPWQISSIESLENEFGVKVLVYQGTQDDLQYIVQQRSAAIPGAMNWDFYTPPGLCESFRAVFRQLAPDIVVINYAIWGKLASGDEFKSAVRVMETHDLFTLNIKMGQALAPYLNTDLFDPNQVNPNLVDESFFARLHLEPDPEEYQICDRYEYTTTVSPYEAQLIRQNTRQTQVLYIPVTLQAEAVDNTYTDAPLFVIGMNSFNVQGYLYFASKILPKVLREVPDFSLRVIGDGCRRLVPVDGIELLGFVPDLKPLYASSQFAICPLIGGTGQQVKIVEAMAHGVPVIALRNTARTSPIEHGINGFIADNAEEFVQYTIQLFRSRELCRKLGQAARQRIADNFSQKLLVQNLKQVTDKTSTVRTEKAVPSILVDGVFFQLYQTGIARVWQSLLSEWAATGFAKHIVVLDRAGTAPKIPGVWYRQMPAYDYNNIPADREMLQQVCDEEGADLFVSTYYTTPVSTPSVLMAYDMIPEVMGGDIDHPNWRGKHHAIQYASAYMAISENTARDLVRFFPDIPIESVTVAHCGVKSTFSPARVEDVNSFRTKYGISKPYFILVGAGGGYKNTELFLQAFAQIPSKQGFEIVCTGSGSLLADEWRAYTSGSVVHMLQLSDEELRAAYSGAVALVYPSKYEGFGLPVLEALACGCPVIACPNASIPEVAGEAALYVNDDVDGLANALCEVQKPAIRKSLIAKGLEQAKKFSWSKMAKTVSSVLIDATLLPLKLKEINLIVFPDWSQPEESLGMELQEVMRAIATHPDKSRMTLLVDTSNIDDEEEVNLLLSSVAMNLMMEEDLDVAEGPEISLVGQLGEIQWEALLPRIHGRIALENENKEAIARAKAESIPLRELDNM